jgi:RHS repeat-associated protein
LAGRLTGSAGPFGAVQYAPDGLGRPSSRQVIGQSAVTYSYDQAGNLLSSTAPQVGAAFSYDGRNEPLTLLRANGVSTAYKYDPLGRLLSLTRAKGASVLNSENYTYDAVGNRTGNTNTIAQALVTQAVGSAAYDANNQQNQSGLTTNTFDANGNLIAANSSSGNTTYSWDARNRLTSVSTSNGQTTRFIYDFAGNLIQQADTGPSLNLTLTFVLDDRTNVAYVSRSDGDQYSVLAGRSLDQHVGVVHASGQIEYGLADAINSTVATVDQTGTIQSQFFYEPFGQTTRSGTYPFQYTGRVPVTPSLYYYRARFYGPTSGRFLSEDTIGIDADINLYTYVNNGPVGFTDPKGLFVMTYGNYCGPSNHPVAPVTRTDYCCAAHDFCYQHSGVDFWHTPASDPRVKACDQALVDCVKKVRSSCLTSSTEKRADDIILRIFENRN